MKALTHPSARRALAIVATLAIVVPLGWMWWSSRLPSSYSMMSLGYVDAGGGPGGGGHTSHQGAVDVATLTGPEGGTPDVDLTLTARKEPVKLSDGRSLPGYTLNGSSPGPGITAQLGDLVQVTLVNDNVEDGITLHWHGLHVPNAEDGVAGVTQDAAGPGEKHTYRFLAEQTGTYWYHSHNVGHEQVKGGLFGTLVIRPARAQVDGTATPDADVDVVVPVHVYGSAATVRGRVSELRVPAEPGDDVRLRVVNTSESTLRVWAGGHSFRLAALDGVEWNEPGDITGKSVPISAGGRADVTFRAPGDGSPVRVGTGVTSVVVGGGDEQPARLGPPPEPLDLLTYGTPAGLGFDPEQPDRRFDYAIGRRPGFVDGMPGLWWSINGHLYPDVPMFTVAEGDVVAMTLTNNSGQSHPMHLHGHHVVVLSRNGVPSRGGPWRTDSLEVGDGDTYEVAFAATNLGVWADHCHQLEHAAQGFVAHLAYTGYTTTFTVGGVHRNTPE